VCASTPSGIQKTCRPHPGESDEPHHRPDGHIDNEPGNNDDARKPPDQSPGADVACPICRGLRGYVLTTLINTGVRWAAANRAMAERLPRKIDRINPARVRGPYRRAGRGALVPRPKILGQYYNKVRTHRSLDKDTHISRPVLRAGSITSYALLGGLHHHYVRVGVFGTHRRLSF